MTEWGFHQLPEERKHIRRPAAGSTPEDELAAKRARSKDAIPASAPNQPFFGLTVVHCERGAIRQSPDGVYVYDRDGRREIACGTGYRRGAAELMELADALGEGREPFLDAAWGRATLEVCVAILESGAQRRELELRYQVPAQSVGTW